MIRYLLFTLIGFFGPALLMLFLRLLWAQCRERWLKQKGEHIIDVTPIRKKTYSPWFIGVWLALSVSCTAFLIVSMDSKPASETTYIPAHIDASGQFIPAQQLNKKDTPD